MPSPRFFDTAVKASPFSRGDPKVGGLRNEQPGSMGDIRHPVTRDAMRSAPSSLPSSCLSHCHGLPLRQAHGSIAHVHDQRFVTDNDRPMSIRTAKRGPCLGGSRRHDCSIFASKTSQPAMVLGAIRPSSKVLKLPTSGKNASAITSNNVIGVVIQTLVVSAAASARTRG